jgi:hypothetical protein
MLSAYCLAAVMYFETLNQPRDAMLGVAQVVLEHRDRANSTVCKAVKPGIFSWQSRYRFKTPKPRAPADRDIFERQQKLARAMLFKGLRTQRLRGHYVYFNHKSLGRRYKTDVKLVRIGDLVFY